MGSPLDGLQRDETGCNWVWCVLPTTAVSLRCSNATSLSASLQRRGQRAGMQHDWLRPRPGKTQTALVQAEMLSRFP